MADVNDKRGVLERSLANMRIGVAASIKGRASRLRDTYQGEYENQVHVPMSGNAPTTWGFGDKTVIFNMPMFGARTQRMVPFEQPHFTYGIEFEQSGGTLVVIHAAVMGWTINESGWYTGATVRFGVIAPIAGATYKAIAHLSFQGYGCIPEQQEFDA